MDRAVLDGHPAWEVFAAGEERGGTVEGVQGVVQCRAFLWLRVDGTQEEPLLSGYHLGADLGITLVLELHCQPVQLVAELPEVLVFPDDLVLVGRGFQNAFNVCVVFS